MVSVARVDELVSNGEEDGRDKLDGVQYSSLRIWVDVVCLFDGLKSFACFLASTASRSLSRSGSLSFLATCVSSRPVSDPAPGVFQYSQFDMALIA